MNIDRHNYEEFFLLYIDNELNMADKKQVELFVKENPDLEEEFLMLQQSKLIADDNVMFEGKEMLMKNEAEGINMNNYEEWLVQYTDDELNATERKQVEEFAAANEGVKEELNLFAQTRLYPETIAFPNKESLYRKEERRATIITMKWWRVAAAAILIIAAGITTYTVVNGNKKNSGGAGKAVAVDNKKDQPKNSSINGNNSSTDQNDSRPNMATSPNTRQVQGAEQVSPRKEIDEKTPSNLMAKQNETKEKSAIKKDNYTQEEDRSFAVNALNVQKQDDQKNQTTTTAILEDEQRTRTKFTDVATTKPTSNPIAKADISKDIINTSAVTNALSETPIDVEKPRFASNNKGGSLRVFFRKATRFIERTTKINPANDDDKVLIGGMAINLK